MICFTHYQVAQEKQVLAHVHISNAKGEASKGFHVCLFFIFVCVQK